MTRAAWNRFMDVYDGPAFGSALRLAHIACRKVIRDESGGIDPSPPFGAWITCPITNPLIGCQTDPLSAFDLTRGDRLWDSTSGLLLGVVLWAETWLPGTVNNYQRVYVLNLDPLDELAFNLCVDLSEYPNYVPRDELKLDLSCELVDDLTPVPPTDLLLELSLYLQEYGATPVTTDLSAELALTMEENGVPPPGGELSAELALEMEDDRSHPPWGELFLDLAIEMEEHGVPPPSAELSAELALELEGNGVPPLAVDLYAELALGMEDYGSPVYAVDLAAELALDMYDGGNPPLAVDLYAELALELEDGGSGPPTPGATCGAAPDVSSGVLYSYSVAGGASQWFKLPIPAGGIWHVDTTGIGGSTTIGIFNGISCGSATSVSNFVSGGCFDTSPFTLIAGYLYFQFFGTMGGGAYTFQIGTGTC